MLMKISRGALECSRRSRGAIQQRGIKMVSLLGMTSSTSTPATWQHSWRTT